MDILKVINANGFKALGDLAGDRPELFFQRKPTELRDEMEQIVRSEHGPDATAYDKDMSLKISLEEMNELTEGGPGSDAKFAPLLRDALGDLTPAQSSEMELWASINCFVLSDYVPARWTSSNLSESGSTNFVDRHWLAYSGSSGRKWNASARLWWLGEIAKRAEPYSEHTFDKLLQAIAGNVNLYHQTIDRAYLSANPKFIAAVYDVFLDDNDHLKTTNDANRLVMALNMRAATTSFDWLEYDELRRIVEEAKPPKGS